MNNEKKVEMVEMEVFEKLYELYGITRQALIYAGCKIEGYGWCPKAKDNDLYAYFETCAIARKKSFRGCYWCISMNFFEKAENDLAYLKEM